MSVTLNTDVGDIKTQVFFEQTPKSCENFLFLCAKIAVISWFQQERDLIGSGKGGNSIRGRKFEYEYRNYLTGGVTTIANHDPNTNGSQFFITYGKQLHLDTKYAVFEKVVDDLEALDELQKIPVNEKNILVS
ncbi:peptidyl-prolyl cis-trans isomerase-like 3 [Monodelphis domestica]|uniref:peptidyl-prolyl cis-trans isomerase-like 3 n=1 Tax=Monodelphis domestica TaxID=13616 RepID=UPI0024E21DC6|nr:peptidyl-prolyl cis-trans isomerase-like 3 [Monodelphis domestica]